MRPHRAAAEGGEGHISRRRTVVLVTSEGSRWREQCSFTINTLKNFGMGRKCAKALIQRELRELVDDLQAHPEEALDPHAHLMKPIGNVVFSIVFSKRLSEHPKCEQLAKELRDSYKAIDYKYLPLRSLLERFKTNNTVLQHSYMWSNSNDCKCFQGHSVHPVGPVRHSTFPRRQRRDLRADQRRGQTPSRNVRSGLPARLLRLFPSGRTTQQRQI